MKRRSRLEKETLTKDGAEMTGRVSQGNVNIDNINHLFTSESVTMGHPDM